MQYEFEFEFDGVIEFETATGLHGGYDVYKDVNELENMVRNLIHKGYVITAI